MESTRFCIHNIMYIITRKFEELILCDISRSTRSRKGLGAKLLLGTCVYVYKTYTTFQGPKISLVMSGVLYSAAKFIINDMFQKRVLQS